MHRDTSWKKNTPHYISHTLRTPAGHRQLSDCCYSRLKHCHALPKLDSLCLQTCGTVICEWRHPTEQQEQGKTFTSPPPAIFLLYSHHDCTLSCSQCFALQPDISLPFLLYYLFNDKVIFRPEQTCHPHTYLYLHDAIAFFFSSSWKDGFEARPRRWNKNSADINIIIAGGGSREVLFEHFIGRSLSWF